MNRYWKLRGSLNPMSRYLFEDRLKRWDAEDEERAEILAKAEFQLPKPGRPRQDALQSPHCRRAKLMFLLEREFGFGQIPDRKRIAIAKSFEEF